MSGLQARRATVDDLPELRGLWGTNHLPIPDLERRVTEFQIVTNDAQELLGAVGLQIEKHHGKIHSPAISPNEHEAQVRSLLWDRLHTVAKNNGLVRLWQSAAQPFVKNATFENPSEEALKRAPGSFGVHGTDWITLKLREESAEAAISLDKEFSLFAESQRVSTERMMEQGRKFRTIAYGIALFVMGTSIILFAIAFSKEPKLRPWNKNNSSIDSKPRGTNAAPKPATNSPPPAR
jgi:N-acetylglutamate synthase-like GNAT family acetyltransferase